MTNTKSSVTAVIGMLIFPLLAYGATPVHLGKISIDTSIYDMENATHVFFVPDPFVESFFGYPLYTSQMFLQGLYKKNSNQIDLYSYNGKFSTAIVPTIKDSTKVMMQITLSRTMIDDDAGWESLVDYIANNKHEFEVFDDDGTKILSGTGRGFYGFDGNSTYIFGWNGDDGSFAKDYESWRFRTNIMSPSNQPLAKTKSSQSLPMQIYGLTGGDYRVTLSPSNGNQMNFQMFDLMGRCLFSKKIDNLTSPVSFTVPAGDVPNSPFIAKVNDGNGSFYKKQIPVR